MEKEIKDQDHYLAVLLYYACNLDAEIEAGENRLAIEKVGEETWAEVKRDYADVPDSELLEIITSRRKEFFPGIEGKEKMISELRKLFRSDEHYSQVEYASLGMLVQML